MTHTRLSRVTTELRACCPIPPTHSRPRTYILTHGDTWRHTYAQTTHMHTSHTYTPPPHTHILAHTYIQFHTHTVTQMHTLRTCILPTHAYLPHIQPPHIHILAHIYNSFTHCLTYAHTTYMHTSHTYTPTPHTHTHTRTHIYTVSHTHTHTYCLTHKLRILSQEQRIITSQCLLSDIPDIQCLYAFNM